LDSHSHVYMDLGGQFLTGPLGLNIV
jgi:hypothetical protein